MRPGRFKLERLARYPHMGREDAEVWNRWIHVLRAEALGVDYDVRVGPGLPVDPEAEPAMQDDWLLLTQLRIDAVVYLPRATWLVEVKPRLLPSALGQILSYGYWWERENDQSVPVSLIALVERSDDQLEPVFTRHGVRVVRA
jgi:hypothetical protein